MSFTFSPRKGQLDGVDGELYELFADLEACQLAAAGLKRVNTFTSVSLTSFRSRMLSAFG